MRSDRFNKLSTNIFIFLISFISIAINTEAVQAEEHHVIRVGYTSDKGYIEKEGDLYTGYLYDYLREISIYTNWEYEFIEMDTSTALNALKDGEIDLMGGMINNESTMKLFDFPKYDMGYTYNTLVVSNDNENYNGSTYALLDGIKVGYLETAKGTLNNFLDFCKDNGIQDVELIPFDKKTGADVFEEKLKTKEIDAIMGGDLSTNEIDGKVVARFGATPYYFATTKGNTEIVDELNKALIKIEEQDSSFEQKLYNKYFQSNDENLLILSKDEEAYIKAMKPLKVAYLTNYMPVQYYNEDKKSPDGILVKYIKLLAQRTNMPIEFVAIANYEEGYQLLKNNEVDLVLGILDDYLIADKYHFSLTKTILRIDMQKILNKDLLWEQDIEENKKNVAVPQIYSILEESINAKNEYYSTIEDGIDHKIKYYSSAEESIKAVNEGKAGMTHVSSYVANHYMAQDIYENIAVYPSGEQISLAIGVAKDLDKDLLSVITKSIYAFSEQDMRSIVNETVTEMYSEESLKQFVKTHLEAVILSATAILSVIGILIARLIKMRFDRLKEVKKILFEKTQLDGLTGIYNREACERLVKEYLKTKNPLLYAALIIIDIDHFKQINDQFGHRMGDNLLIEFSSILNQFFAHHDIVSRLGGDEFIVFMTDIDKQDIEKVNEKLEELCKLMNRKIEHNGATQQISLSVGVVITQEDIEFNKLYTMADEMLYEVKRNGRNGFKIKDIS